MRRRRSAIAADSLDLLLDTITNTFGGILLLALLLVLLVRDSHESADQASGAELASPAERRITFQGQVAQLTAQRDVLRQSLAAQDLFNSGDDNSQSQELMQQLSQLLKQVGSLRAATISQASLHDQLEKRIESQADQLSQLGTDLSRLQLEALAADADLQTEQSRRTQVMDLPKEQVTSKRMAVVVVKSNHLYLLHDRPGLAAFRYNANHFKETNLASADVVLSDGTYLSTIPENGASMKAEDVTKTLSTLDAKTVFLTIAIGDDSFETFGELRSSCVQLGLEYKILPVSEFPVVEGRASQLPRAQ